MKKILSIVLSLLMVLSIIPMALVSAEAETVSKVLFDFEDQTGLGSSVGDVGSRYVDTTTLSDAFEYWKETSGAYSAGINGKSNYTSFNLPDEWWIYYDEEFDATFTKPSAITFEITCSTTSKSAEVGYVAFDKSSINSNLNSGIFTDLTIVGANKASSKTKATITCEIPAGLDLSEFTRFVMRVWGTNDLCYVDNITLVYPISFVATFQGTETAVLETEVADEVLDFSANETTITLPNATLADGKTFAGWVSEYDTVTVLPAGTEVEIDKNTVFYAVAADRTAYATPDAPVVIDITKDSVTLEAVDGYLYSLDGLTWQEANVFTGLAAGTEYTFYQKVAGTVAYLESAISAGAKAKTPWAYDFIFNNANVTLSDNDMGVTFGNNDGYPNINKSGITVGQSVTLTSVNSVAPGVYAANLWARSYAGRAAVDVEINGTVVAESLDTSSGGVGIANNMAYALSPVTITEEGPVVIKFTATTAGSLYLNSIDFVMPYTVKIDGEVIGSGAYGETVTLPEEEVYGYSDGTTLYQPGEEITITGDIEFTTIIRSIEEADFDVDVSEKEYTAEEITTTVTPLTDLVEGTDYEVAYKDNVNIGTATVTVTGINQYFGTVEKTFEITTKTISEDDFSISATAYEYTKEAITPEVITSLPASDYEVAYKDNVNVGTATITVTGKGNCAGTVNLTFDITQKAIEETDFTFDLEDKVYTGEEIKPVVTSTLTDADYEVSYSDNINVGEATITVTSKGNYKGAITKTFNITQKAIEETDFTFDLEDKVYTGEEIKPVVTSTLTEEDYEVAYSNNVNVGTATITVTGKGNYEGVITKEFEITPKAISITDFETLGTYTYENAAFTPALTVTEDSYVTADDYDVAYKDNVNAGTGVATVTGKGNYTGTVELQFVIAKRTISEDDFTFDLADKIFTGEEIKPAVTSEILKDTDYEVSYSENINVGTATISVMGADNCDGVIQKEFKITEREITEADFVFDLEDKVYTGEKITPAVTVAEDTCVTNDYFEVAYSNNIDVGTATITVTGVNNCQGTVTKTFKIVEKAIAETDFTFDLEDKVYTGEEIKPAVTVNNELVTENDYEVTYSENINVGTAKITVDGKGNFGGKVEKEFAIVAKEITDTDFTVDLGDKVYTGAEITPDVTSEIDISNYVISYENNTNVGTATITVEARNNYSGTITKTFAIIPKAIESSNFVINTSSASYTGKAITKSVSSALVYNKDYKVAYTNNVKVGTATITVTGIGNYSGTVVKTFKITAPKVTVKIKKLKVTPAQKKKATVKWKKSNKVTGYVIQYSLKKNFKGKKTVYVTKAKTVKKVIKKLKSGKKYYVRIAGYKSYKKTGKAKTFKAIGKYSKAKTVKVK